ncbi:unnamed protein product [Arabis nemorensis]|uniref:TPX2 C-terminal domain-containing protein n=1 Tax=Arabis nemorensis TaxID=586526 RepID=A0A565BRW4_9BRAS|nr:unnamed protein product [Arabis nemorensis]
MGESVCLVRSFSQPAEISSIETNEAVSRRFLTESVSFGRFASETLQWEKWSAFTQNRYLEEVERFTKPGSVAQKKAFFEAHFKNRASGRATQTKIEEVNVKACDDEIVREEVRKDDIVDSSEVPLEANNGMSMNKEVSNAEVAPSVSVIDETTDVQTDEVKDTSVENIDSVADVQTGEVKDISVDDSVAVPEGEDLDKEDSTSLSKERRSSSSGSKTCSGSSKLEPSFVIGLDQPLNKTRKEPPSSSKRSISVSKNQNRSPRVPFHMSISCAPSGNNATQHGSRSKTNAKSAGKADKKKGSGPSSVHMSLNVASSARQTTKTAPKNLARKSTTQETTSSNARNSVFPNGNEPTGASKSHKRPLPQKTKEEGSRAAKCSTSASAVRLPELPPPSNRLSADKRKGITEGSSVSYKIPHHVKRQPSVGCQNISTRSRTKAKSLTVSSPFNFRSDERAEKRKEFFKKLEEKSKKEDSGKEQLSCGFKANQKTHLVSEEHKNPQVGNFQVVPLISPTSPRFRTNQTSGRGNIKKSHQSPHKVASVKTRNAVMEKLKSCKIHPSQTKKKAQENLSPNIPQN